MVMCSNAVRTILLAGACLALGGCLAVVGGAALGGGAYAYHKGKVTAQFDADFANSWHAVKEALGDLALPLKGEKRNGLAGTIESATHTGSAITIHLEEKPLQPGLPTHRTEVGVRVGVFGDTDFSERLLEQIRQRLGSRAMPPLPAAPAAVAPPPGSPPPVPSQERIPAQ